MGFDGGESFLASLQEMTDVTMRTGHRMADAMVDRGQELIKQNTPVRTHHLRESHKRTDIDYRPVPGLGYRVYAWTGRVYTEVEYAPFVEMGTGLWGPRRAKYVIKPKKPGGVLRFTPYQYGADGSVVLDVDGAPSAGGRVVTVRFVLHPGSPGHYMYQIGTRATEMEMQEWSRYPLQLWNQEAEALFK